MTLKHNNMAFCDEFQRYRSVGPSQMLQGIVISILLHSTLLIGSKNWLTAFMPEPKQEIPIEVVEVSPEITHTPRKTLFRATKDSIAGGKALPKRPVRAVKLANSNADKASSKSPFDLRALSPGEVFQPSPRQHQAKSPNLSPQQPKPRKTSFASATIPLAPKPQKIAIAPTTPLAPKVEPTVVKRATIPLAPKPQKIAVVPTTPLAPQVEPTAFTRATIALASKPQKIAVVPTTPPAPKVEPTVLKRATIPPVASPEKIAVAPNTESSAPKVESTVVKRATTLPAPKPQKIAIARATTPSIPNSKNLGQSGTLLSRRTPYIARPSLNTGAASLLSGTVSVSSRNFSGDDLAALPNSNRDRQATSGIDAIRQDIDIASYLNQLQQRVKQQWLPGLSQSSRRTVLNFSINRNGQLSNLQLAQTSGFSVTDQAALNAIQRAAPFAPLPTGYPNKYIQIQFTFNINVYGELNLSGDGS